MNIAIIGSGVAGLMAARKLHEWGHHVTLFEKESSLGGHIKTFHVPHTLPSGEERSFAMEMGVFMYDPQMIHPLMGQYVKEWEIATRPIPLSFAFHNDHSQFSWSFETGDSSLLRDFRLISQVAADNLYKSSFFKHLGLLYELRNFTSQWPEIIQNPRYRMMTVEQFLKEEEYSDRFRDEWLLPQMHCWWGITREYALESNIQVLVDPMYKVSLCPQYIFVDGWESFSNKIAEPIEPCARLASPVKRVSRKEQSVEVITEQGTRETFDSVIFATPPNVCAHLLEQPSLKEETILNSFLTTTTEVFLHKDPRWMPPKKHWSTVNLVQEKKEIFTTLWYGKIYPEEPNIFISWGESLADAIDPAQVVEKIDMLRTLPNNDYVSSCHAIKEIQGQGNVWYCGAHVDALTSGDGSYAVPSLWHENAFKSGIDVAYAVHEHSAKETFV